MIDCGKCPHSLPLLRIGMDVFTWKNRVFCQCDNVWVPEKDYSGDRCAYEDFEVPE